jgi:multidrug efflux pump subunit AcrB
VLEDSLSGIEGIDFITSISRQESSQITVRFKLDRNPDYAAADVRDRVGRVRGRLPDEIDEPIIQKVEADAQPIFHLAFFSDRHSELEITDYANRYVKDQLTTLPGVAEVRMFGDREYSMRIWRDPERLAAYELTPQDVEAALRRQNVEVPSGRIHSTGPRTVKSIPEASPTRPITRPRSSRIVASVTARPGRNAKSRSSEKRHGAGLPRAAPLRGRSGPATIPP